MKGDMRFTYPLWQMGMIAILIAFVWLTQFTTFFKVFEDGGFEFEISFGNEIPFLFIGIQVLLVAYLLLFYWKIRQHNKRMPAHRITAFSWKPPEYMEDDELFQEVTKRATKNVYTYFVWALPILSVVYILLPIGKRMMIIGLLFLALGQFGIYYLTMRKMLKGEGIEEE